MEEQDDLETQQSNEGRYFSFYLRCIFTETKVNEKGKKNPKHFSVFVVLIFRVLKLLFIGYEVNSLNHRNQNIIALI